MSAPRPTAGALICVVSYRLQDEVPRTVIKEGPDFKIQHPVLPPTALPANPDRVQRRPTRPIPVGVRVEHRLHAGLQIPAHDGLGDPIRDSRPRCIGTDQDLPVATCAIVMSRGDHAQGNAETTKEIPVLNLGCLA